MSILQTASRYRRVLLSITVMVFVTGASTVTAFIVLYQAAFNGREDDLVEMVNVKAGLINAVGRFDAQHSYQDFPDGAFAATLSQVKDANLRQQGFGQTGEFAIGQKLGQKIIFNLPSRNLAGQIPQPIEVDSEQFLPMQLALQGKRGVMIATDYRGVEVMAAYVPLEESGYALVAKIDTKELRKPFYRAVFFSFSVAIILILVAVILLHRLTSPLIDRLEALVKERTQALDQANKELLFLSQHDSLTGIGNRARFLQQLKISREEPGNKVALLIIDLDAFKPVNDRYGHPTGDSVLAQIGKRLKSVVRTCDCVARIGGDEFALILQELDSEEEAVAITEEVIEVIRQPIQITQGGTVSVGCSVGIAFNGDVDESDAALISRADTAMYKAKRQKGRLFCVG